MLNKFKMSNLINTFNWRYATKVFDSSKKISDENLNILIESLRLAPSSYGLQPWKFILVENTDLRTELKAHSWNQSQITDASHLFVLAVNKEFKLEHITKLIQETAKTRWIDTSVLKWYEDMMINWLLNSRTQEQLFNWSKNQVYIALWFLLMTAAELGIDTCPIEWFDPTKYDEILWLDKLWLVSAVVCPVGYRSSEDKYAQAPKVRYSQSEVIIRI